MKHKLMQILRKHKSNKVNVYMPFSMFLYSCIWCTNLCLYKLCGKYFVSYELSFAFPAKFKPDPQKKKDWIKFNLQAQI
jgi:hypothetical protein